MDDGLMSFKRFIISSSVTQLHPSFYQLNVFLRNQTKPQLASSRKSETLQSQR